MTTHSNIFVSRKLESILPTSLLQTEPHLLNNTLGKWNATLFYVSRKKCLLMTNSTARYSVFLPGLTKSDFSDITPILIENLEKQFAIDGISINQSTLLTMIGEVSFHRTDNDKKIIGTQNHILEYVEDWKYEFGDFVNWDFFELGRRVNGIPYRQIDWLSPKEKMKTILSENK